MSLRLFRPRILQIFEKLNYLHFESVHKWLYISYIRVCSTKFSSRIRVTHAHIGFNQLLSNIYFLIPHIAAEAGTSLLRKLGNQWRHDTGVTITQILQRYIHAITRKRTYTNASAHTNTYIHTCKYICMHTYICIRTVAKKEGTEERQKVVCRLIDRFLY